MNAKDILKTAMDTLDQRGMERDQEGERSMERAVDLFNIMVDQKGSKAPILSERDGWIFMIALKLARSERSDNPDHYIDLAGYIALLGEHVMEGVTGPPMAEEEEPTWPDWDEKPKAKPKPATFMHTCNNCKQVYTVFPDAPNCPICASHYTYSPL